ncbi:two-component sensor histidine kinase, partial [Asanoa sp. NPDC050611]
MKRFRPTLRTRLTLVYGGLFLLGGIVVLGVTHLLVEQQIRPIGGVMVNRQIGPGQGAAHDTVIFRTADGAQLPAEDVPDYLAKTNADVRSDALTSQLTQGGIALGLVGSAAIGLGWLVAGRVLAPLHRVTDTARRIARGADLSLHERIGLTG